MKVFKKMPRIFFLLTVAFILRLILSPYGTLYLDFNSWVGWSHRLTEVGFSRFYEAWSDYLPGYLYVLWFLGQLKNIFPHFPYEILYKLPSILADLVTAYLIFSLLKNLLNEKKALLVSAFYLFNPAILANSTLWGQADSFSTMLVVLAFYLLWQEKYLLSSTFFSIAFLTKPQSIIFLPFVFLPLVKKKKLKTAGIFLFVFLGLFVLAFLPFAGAQNLIVFIWERLGNTFNQYPFTSVNAFNFWALVGGFWRTDGQVAFLFTPKQWGILIFGFINVVLLLFLWKRGTKNNEIDFKRLFFSLALVSAAAFLFLTRVHERHLFPFFAFLAITAGLEPKLWFVYLFYSLIYILNLRFSFVWITQDFREIFPRVLVNLISFANLVAFLFIFLSFFKNKWLGRLWRRIFPAFKKQPLLSEGRFIKRYGLVILAGLLLFAFLTRFWRLGYPSGFYFDEVYHAFTATQMVKGNPFAWEWWNEPPPGVAYEWSHPPLAKLVMAAGIFIFGERAFGWRFFGALLGVGCVFLVYLLGRKIFNQKVGLLAAFLFAFDGLTLVMSRIGMNDIYFLFFGLLAVWLFLKERYFLSGLIFGLSLSSKWTAIWWLLVFIFWWFLELLKEKRKKRFLFLIKRTALFICFFLILPFGVYLLSYLPFFLIHRDFSLWCELQKQMWWYHTRLRATHPFASPWWSWMILKRPVWLFVNYTKDKIANIYAMGNPLVCWGGLISLPFVIWLAVKTKSQELGLTIFAYFALFLPWAFSPRIMFIYHYLPAFPFLCLFLAWLLLWLARKKEFKPIFVGYLLLVVIVFLFFYPHWTGIEVAKWWDNLYYWLPSWR